MRHSRALASFALLLALVPAAHGQASAFLALCASSTATSPLNRITAGARLQAVCSAMQRGADPNPVDLAGAVPAVQRVATYEASWASDARPSSTGQRASRTVVATFKVQLVTGANLAPEVLLGVAQGTTYPLAFLTTSRNPQQVPTSLWTLRNVVVGNFTTRWTPDGPNHTLFLNALASTYRVWVVDPPSGSNTATKYGGFTCFNGEKNAASTTTDAC